VTNRVTIIAELKNHITGPADKATRSTEQLEHAMEKAGQAADQANRSFEHTRNAAGKIVTGLSTADVAAGKYYDSLGRLQQANHGFVKGAERAAWASDQQALAAAKAAKETAKQTKQTTQQRQETDKTTKSLSLLEKAMLGARGSSQRMHQAFDSGWRDAEQGPDRLRRALSSTGTQMVAEAKTIGQGIKNGIQSSLDSIDVSGLQGALGGLGVGAGIAGSLDRDTESRRIAAANGLDPEATRELTDQIFNEGYGTDYNALATNAGTVVATFDLEPGSPEAEALLRGNATMVDAFGLDPDALTMAVKLMADNDEISFEQSQAQLAEALQKATPRGRDEMLDNIQEYTPFLNDTGISAGALVTMLSGATGQGAMASDKTGDAIKEFGVRAIDSSNKGYSEDYAELGIDQQEISRRLQSGDASAFTDVVTALDGIEDQATQARLAVGIFGTPLEDLGVGNIDDQISAWADLDMAITGSSDTLEGMQDTMQEGVGHDWNTAWRDLSGAFIEIGDALAPVVSLLADVISFLAKPIAFVSTILAAGGALKMLLVPLNGVLGLFGKTLTMSALLRGGLSLLWKLFMVTPLGRAITIITALALGFKWLYENVGWARDAMDWFYNSMVKGFQVFDDIGEKIDTLIDEKIPALRAALDFGNGATEGDDRSWGERIQDAGAATGEALGLPDMSGNRDERADRHQERGFLPGFYSGGYTGDLPTNAVAGAVHGREFVFDAASTASIGVHNLEAARSAGTLPVAATLGTAAPAPVVVQGDTVAIHIEDARDPGAVIRQIEAFFAQRDQARALTYATPSLRGAY